MDADGAWMAMDGADGCGWMWMDTDDGAGDYQVECNEKNYLLDVWGATSMWLSDDARGSGGGGHCHCAMVATVDRGCANGRVSCGCIECDADG